jgi:hypothetical protein
MDFFDTVCIYGNIGDAIINVADAIVYVTDDQMCQYYST